MVDNPTETNWHVFTGDPSSGKSKLMDYFAYLGYSVMPISDRAHFILDYI